MPVKCRKCEQALALSSIPASLIPPGRTKYLFDRELHIVLDASLYTGTGATCLACFGCQTHHMRARVHACVRVHACHPLSVYASVRSDPAGAARILKFFALFRCKSSHFCPNASGVTAAATAVTPSHAVNWQVGGGGEGWMVFASLVRVTCVRSATSVSDARRHASSKNGF